MRKADIVQLDAAENSIITTILTNAMICKLEMFLVKLLTEIIVVAVGEDKEMVQIEVVDLENIIFTTSPIQMKVHVLC